MRMLALANGWRSLIACAASCVMLCLVLAGASLPAQAAIAPGQLQQAMQDFDTLKVDARRSQWREPWEKLAARFSALYAQGGDLAPEALFYQARSMDELGARSKRKEDLQEGVRLYNELSDKYPNHALADNAAYNKALILAGRLRNPDAASDALEVLLRRHPGGDMHASAEMLYSRLGHDPRLIKPEAKKTPAAPSRETPLDNAPEKAAQGKAAQKDSPKGEANTPADPARQKALYQEAAKTWRALMDGKESQKAKRRDVWEALEADFQAARAAAPSGPLAASAAYQAARCRGELAARSFNAEDWREAVSMFHATESAYPKSSLADDALLRAAKIRMEKLDDRDNALADLDQIIRNYPKADMTPEATRLRKEWGGAAAAKAVAPAGKTSRETSAEKASGGKSAPAEAADDDDDAILSGPVSEDFEAARQREAEAVKARVAQASGSGETGNGAVQSLDGKGVLRRIVWEGSETDGKVILELAGRSKYGRKTMAGSGKNPATVRMTLFGATLDGSVDKTLNLKGLPMGRVSSAQNGGDVTVDITMPSAESYRVSVLYDPYRLVIESSLETMLPGGFDMKGQPIAAGKERAARASGGAKAAASGDLLDQLGLSIKTVMLDAGHGGKDPGAMGNGLKESEYTLKLAKEVSERLKNHGIEVLHTRRTDKFIALEDRTGTANEKRADVFVSIHVNASTNKKLSGIETYFLDVARSDAAAVVAARENAVKVNNTSDLQFILSDLTRNSKKSESEAIATTVQNGMLKRLRSAGYSVHDNGVRSAPFYVLMGARMPAFLVEVGYLSNATDAERLKQDKYLNALADGICDGVLAYRDKLRASAAVPGKKTR